MPLNEQSQRKKTNEKEARKEEEEEEKGKNPSDYILIHFMKTSELASGGSGIRSLEHEPRG